jgi:3,4-dihydroxy-2-butanone 4-phosphate synthase
MFDPVEEVLAAIRRGEIVVVADDENRENEGDLVMAAEKATDKAVNFMTKYGRGLLCVSLTDERVKRLGLNRMALRGDGDRFGTAFMESVDAADGVSTGISAADRARTIAVLIDEDASRESLISPGHMFPLESMRGGVLRRAGHTEGSVDLARLAGLRPAGVICEILQEDGTMARLPELAEFAREHGLKFTSIAELIAYRRRTEKITEFVRAVDLPTEFGMFKLHLYRSLIDDEHHVALVLGSPVAESGSLDGSGAEETVSSAPSRRENKSSSWSDFGINGMDSTGSGPSGPGSSVSLSSVCMGSFSVSSYEDAETGSSCTSVEESSLFSEGVFEDANFSRYSAIKGRGSKPTCSAYSRMNPLP